MKTGDASYWKLRARKAEERLRTAEGAVVTGRIAAFVAAQAAAYPLDVFPPVEPGCAPDRYSAAMARHCAATWAERIRRGDY
jgi:hypothetical protein